MRAVFVLFALAVAACDPNSLSGLGAGASPGEGYTLEVRAGDAEQTYVVTAPDGRVVAARASGGASMLLDGEVARALGAAQPLSGAETPEVFALRMPGVNISISADADNPDSDSARVSIDAGGHSVLVDADEGGPGDADDRAHVRINGASAETAREFVVKADELSPEVQARMLAALGLD